MAMMGLFGRLTNEASFAGLQVLLLVVVLAVTFAEALGANLLCSQVLETGMSVLLLPSLSLLAHVWWFCVSQTSPQKEKEGTLSAFPVGHIFRIRTSSGSITHLSCLLHHLCCHLAVFFLVYFPNVPLFSVWIFGVAHYLYTCAYQCYEILLCCYQLRS